MKRILIPFIALVLASCTDKEQEMLLLQLQSDIGPSQRRPLTR